ncbi:hypothetical protein E2P81_ATG03214 [Venturia nashicola]|uniref:Uncharacterized protein n=1 Tax=Venturia nashicola TaxID=86259 RepID=A0A4Z1P4B3_9PEZI|nr:hypothetical protein E6O75_ATG03283 [Venturia nashicola]TLD36325.1 hypothetical protein E2P81_ATG03214 [Venturia nashicola]
MRLSYAGSTRCSAARWTPVGEGRRLAVWPAQMAFFNLEPPGIDMLGPNQELWILEIFEDISRFVSFIGRAVALKLSSQAPTEFLNSIHTTDHSMYSTFPDRFWSKNSGHQDLETSNKTGHTIPLNLERPLPPLPASTHSRNNSANDESLSSPLGKGSAPSDEQSRKYKAASSDTQSQSQALPMTRLCSRPT